MSVGNQFIEEESIELGKGVLARRIERPAIQHGDPESSPTEKT